MEMLYSDLFFKISSFCTISDWINFLLSSKRKINNNYIWIMFGYRDHPFLNIKSKEDFLKLPLYISDEDVKNAIINNHWSKNTYNIQIMNRNNVIDHRIQNYVYSIMKTMKQVEKLKFFLQSNLDKEFDWKISLNMKIEELLQFSEEERGELNFIIKNDRINE